MKYQFPEDFLWGVATAAAQMEGGAAEGGRGPSIWDAFAHLPGNIKNGDVPDVSCDSYHLYERDIEMMKEMGVKSYRFSFSWSRIIPEGTGEVNPEGIAYYKKLIAALKANGIVPNATMYHWDLPYKLQIMGGFGNREIITWFTEYANVLLENFGDDVDMWVTFNEPIAVFVGTAAGFFAPGLRNEKYARQCLHNLLVCHGETVKLFRSKHLKHAKIGIVVDVWKHFPAREGNEEDIALTVEANEIRGYGMFLNPIFLGKYTDVHLTYMEEQGIMPVMMDGDMECISQKLDFYGLNFYNGLFDHAEKEKARRAAAQAGGNYQDRPEYHTEKLADVLHMLIDLYHVDVPIYITENGLPQEGDGVPKEQILNDQERIDYVTGVLKALHQAMEEGIEVRGYYIWSLLDNFEWSAGFSPRYGLYYTDYETLERTPKKSAGWYRQVIADNGFEE